METGSHSRARGHATRRHSLRYRVQAPLDVTVLRSGVPDTVPGRLVDLSGGGLAAVMAGELLLGETVGVEIQLPSAAPALRTRAMVRHHNQLRCGMEFIGLSAEQQASIRDWTKDAKAGPAPDLPSQFRVKNQKQEHKTGSGGGSRAPARKRRGRGWIFLLILAAILLSALLWRWHRGWQDLESGLQKNAATTQPQARVPADVMEKLVTHRVDPDYPAAARPEKLSGVIVLDVTVGRDGSVAEIHALNGPAILARSAENALRWWRFEPYRVDGQPVVVETEVAVEFKP